MVINKQQHAGSGDSNCKYNIQRKSSFCTVQYKHKYTTIKNDKGAWA
jgi:hypothetical protein